MEGFVGGACSCDIVRGEALEALRTRRCAPRVDSTRTPTDAATSTPEHVVVTMRCASEGAVDVFVEPFVQVRRLDRRRRNAGRRRAGPRRAQPRLRRRVGRRMPRPARRGTSMRAAALGADRGRLRLARERARHRHRRRAAVVASQGHDDEAALETILRRGVCVRRARRVAQARRRDSCARSTSAPCGVTAIHSPGGPRSRRARAAPRSPCRCSPDCQGSPSQSPVGTTCARTEERRASTAGEEIRAVAAAVKPARPHAPRDRSRLRHGGDDRDGPAPAEVRGDDVPTSVVRIAGRGSSQDPATVPAPSRS